MNKDKVRAGFTRAGTAVAGALKGVPHRKAYHLTHDWAGIACMTVTFLDMHGIAQLVLGVGVIFTILDYLFGEQVKIG